MDGAPSLHEAVIALLRAHHAAREALHAQPLPQDYGPERYIAEHHQRRMHLCLDQLEDSLAELADLGGVVRA